MNRKFRRAHSRFRLRPSADAGTDVGGATGGTGAAAGGDADAAGAGAAAAGGGTAGGVSAEDVAALKAELATVAATLAKVRQEKDAEVSAAKQKAAAESAAKLTTDQKVEALTAQIAALQTNLVQKDARLALTQSLQKLEPLPEYAPLLSQITADVTLNEAGELVRDGKVFDPATLRSQYPALFAPENKSSGGGATGGTAGQSSAAKTLPMGQVLTGINPDDMISGKVVLG